MNISNIQEVIFRYYPNYLSNETLEEKYFLTQEHKTLIAICRKGESEIDHWNEFINQIEDRLPESFHIQDWTHLFSNIPCYRLRISYPSLKENENRKRELMLYVSLLVPLYAISISEIDFFTETKKFSIPIIALKNSTENNYLPYDFPKDSIRDRVAKRFDSNATKEFISGHKDSDELLFKLIQELLPKYYKAYEIVSSEFILDVVPGVTNGTNLIGETTYFDCLFTDHVF